MQQKVLGVLIVLGLVAGVSFVQNFWEKHKVKSAFAEVLSPSNAHTFKDRRGLEKRLADQALDIVGEKGKPEIELYHYVGTVFVQDIDVSALPKYGGVQIVGDQVHISALVARVWWYQKILWYKQVDVQVTQAVLVDPDKVGGYYDRPSAQDFDFVEQPWLLLDASK